MSELVAASIKAASGPGDAWGTPMPLWEEIRAKYLSFASRIFDPCPNYGRLLTEAYTFTFTEGCPTRSGLDLAWLHPTFVNPPFSDIEPWAKHASECGSKVVMLLPLRADQPWFHRYASLGKVVFIRGRVNYVDASAPTEKKSGASFASCLLIFGMGTGVEYWWPECHQKRGKK